MYNFKYGVLLLYMYYLRIFLLIFHHGNKLIGDRFSESPVATPASTLSLFRKHYASVQITRLKKTFEKEDK
jgi:hypothetical protein